MIFSPLITTKFPFKGLNMSIFCFVKVSCIALYMSCKPMGAYVGRDHEYR